MMTPYLRKVQYYETDKMGITHHSNYIRFMEEARTDFLSQIGWPYEKLEESGILSPVIGVECEYRNPSTFADILEIRAFIEEFKGARLRISYVMKKQDGSTVCVGHSQHCFVNRAGRPIRLRSVCPELEKTLEEHIEE